MRYNVFISLLQADAPVLAGHFHPGTPDAPATFAYDPAYLSRPDAAALDPFRLAELRPDPVEFPGLAVVPTLRDAVPDAWGRLVAARTMGYFAKKAQDPEGLPEAFFLEAPGDRAGALSVTALGHVLAHHPTTGLERVGAVLRAVEAIASGEMGGVSRDVLSDAATGLGGARPKLTVLLDGALHVAKLPREGDPFDVPRVEHATLRLARACGIDAARSRLETVDGRAVLLVERFDRSEAGRVRHRMVSALTAFGVGDGLADRERWSYLALAVCLSRFARAGDQLAELFRRMAFNALVSNTDDHPRNHAVIHDGRWRLSPAYDLVPTPQVAQDERRLAMAAGAQGRAATLDNLLSECWRFGVSRELAEGIVREMAATIAARWVEIFAEAGVTAADREMLATAFLYPGFGLAGMDGAPSAPEPGGSSKKRRKADAR